MRREWGDHIYELFWRVKKLLDPQGVLNPGTKLSLDDEIAMRDFKSYPRIEEVANACIECGFCESVCPSRHVTVTPRQRIALRREMARQPEGSPVLDALHADYGYDAVDMCAADGTCAIACPISIDTGAMMKQFRALEATETADRIALALAKTVGWRVDAEAEHDGIDLAEHAESARDLGGDRPGTSRGALAAPVESKATVPTAPAVPREVPATGRDERDA